MEEMVVKISVPISMKERELEDIRKQFPDEDITIEKGKYGTFTIVLKIDSRELD